LDFQVVLVDQQLCWLDRLDLEVQLLYWDYQTFQVDQVDQVYLLLVMIQSFAY
jgi:hypothetical protein